MDEHQDLVFLETTRRLAPPSLAREDARVALELLRPALGAGGTLADLGCGYGRHLAALAQLGQRRLVGVDRSALLLAEARRSLLPAVLVRADLRALPLQTASLDAAACFYSSMFLGTEDDAAAALREARRALKPSGLLLITTDNPLRLGASPRSEFSEDLPGLGSVSEESEFDPSTLIDTVRRRLATPQRTYSAEFRIRYFLPEQLGMLAERAGLRPVRLDPLTQSSPQLVALLGRL
jgi:SAM-dependent methyltransferase